MTADSGYADDLKHELLTEMAENFFSRRRRLDERLEAFAVLRERVVRRGAPCLARWHAFRALLLAGDEADRYLAGLGFDLDALSAFPNPSKAHGSRGVPLALTAAGRYRKAVLRAYQALRRELADYNEGGYAPDPREPRRMRRIPGYDTLLSVARDLNREIEAVNACQCPSDMLQFTKSLDPARQEQEHACGGIGLGGSCGLDRELAYQPLDLDALGAPPLPTPPPLDAVEDELSALASRLYDASPEAVRAALKALAKG
jgi:hypothetical protein